MARTGRNKSNNEALNDISYNTANPAAVSFTAGDIEIGAVEIKNATDDTRAKVLAASTAAGATDTPLVVALHPTSPLGAGSAIIGNVRIDQTTPGTTNKVVSAGPVADNGVSTANPEIVGGVAQTGSSYSPAYTAGDAAQLAVDKDSGGLLCHTRTLTRAGDGIAADPKQYTTVSTATPATTDATVFTLAAGEKGFIQNLSADAPLAWKLGASASTSSFNGVLNCGSVADDGKGASVSIDDFTGAVSVAKISGTARYVAFKLS